MKLTLAMVRCKSRHAALFFALPFLLFAKTSFAQNECVAHFTTKGDPRNGAGYVTYITIPNLDIHSALGQIQKMGLDAGLSPGAENYEGDTGTIILFKKDKVGLFHSQQGFPIMAKAQKADNRLIMALQLNQGQVMQAQDAQTLLCGMAYHVTMDGAGAANAAAAHAQTHSDEIINTTATELAQKLTRRAWDLKGLNQDDLQNEYTGKVFRIDGQVSIASPMENYNRALQIQSGNKSLTIAYNTSQVKSGLLRGNGLAFHGNVICHTDPSQLDRFMALRNGDYATVIGKVTQVVANRDAGTLYLDCHFEK